MTLQSEVDHSTPGLLKLDIRVKQNDCVCFDSYHPSQQFFSHVGTGLPGLNQHLAADKCIAQGHNTVTLSV